jgi:peroxiredoxin
MDAGAANIFGLSTQSTPYQREARDRLHLPFELLSDENLALSTAIRLPTMQVAGTTLICRNALVIDDGQVEKMFYPVFPPDRNAGDVLA